MQVVVGFELTPATALSHTIVATSAVASSIYGLIARSPNDPNRTLIDWDLTIFIPALLIGVSVGEPPSLSSAKHATQHSTGEDWAAKP